MKIVASEVILRSVHALVPLLVALALPLGAGRDLSERADRSEPLPVVNASKSALPIVGLAESHTKPLLQPLSSLSLAPVRAAGDAWPVRLLALLARPSAPDDDVPVRAPRFLMTGPARAGP